MKKNQYILYALFAAGMIGTLNSCSDTWDDHYNATEEVVKNATISVINQSITNYLANESSINSIYQLFQETGMIDKLNQNEKMYTILAVEGDMKTNKATSNEDLYTAQTYISDMSISPSHIKDGDRILMWSGKYLNITKETDENYQNVIKFNNATVTKIIKLDNGYLYIVDQMIEAPRSLYEIIENLGEDYSIFKEMVTSRYQLTFDKVNSSIIGVDGTGNTVYDSIFTVKAPYFENNDLDIMSENIKATLLIPSNDVVNEALNTAYQNLKEWGLQRNDTILKNWIFQCAFFNKKYTKEDFENNVDLKSIFSSQWRTTVQEVDLDHPIAMSNGIGYYITKMKIPTNVLIYRLKDYLKWWEFMTDGEKNEYYKTTNLIFKELKTEVTAWTGWPAKIDQFPNIENRVIYFDYEDPNNKTYTLDFTPVMCETAGTEHTITPYKLPAGKWDVHVGFKEKLKGNITVYINGTKIKTITQNELSGSTFHYDRNGGGYPEGYDTKKATHKKKTAYDRDGVKIGEYTSTGEAKPFVIRFEGNGCDKVVFHHWCLKPTADCY